MSQDIRPRNDAPGVDRLELHYRQQLSALVDGALAPDEARFLLRRLEHDRELAGSYERWQLYGQVMRGRLGRMAAPGFAEAVALAVREDAAAVAATGTRGGARHGWMRWGGGAATLAASVAVVALFMGQARDPGALPAASAPTVASTPELPAAPVVAEAAPAARDATPEDAPATHLAAAEPAAVAAVAAAAASRRPARVQPVVREPLPLAEPAREVLAPADAMTVVAAELPAAPFAGQAANEDPFASAVAPHARPWPRAVLPQPATGAFTASFGNAGAQSAGRAFYPFEPALPAPAGGDARPDLAEPPAASEDAPR